MVRPNQLVLFGVSFPIQHVPLYFFVWLHFFATQQTIYNSSIYKLNLLKFIPTSSSWCVTITDTSFLSPASSVMASSFFSCRLRAWNNGKYPVFLTLLFVCIDTVASLSCIHAKLASIIILYLQMDIVFNCIMVTFINSFQIHYIVNVIPLAVFIFNVIIKPL